MGSLFLSEMKKKASSFLQEKYKSARLVLTDVTQAELLESINWKEWRKSYKALVLLDFLLTHGPETVPEEFYCDVGVIEQLGKFKHIDERGFDWGAAMKKKSERILQLLEEGELLKEARSTALKVSKEIQGFGNLLISPSSSSRTSRTSSFGSHSSYSTTTNDIDELHSHDQKLQHKEFNENSGETSPNKLNTYFEADKNVRGSHLWDNPIQEKGSLLDLEEEEEEEKEDSDGGITNPVKQDQEKVSFRSFSNVGRLMKKKMDRQLSLGF
ncbi:uncharacterized protein LOC143861123 isoform X2 [Tasmannia lanceolata]|uniref:uncharacterized protein LOC143861123 isoform X2 n=1 Tax=Tasmannia lanceolata TaxID=3420 RepID=UPI004063B6D0